MIIVFLIATLISLIGIAIGLILFYNPALGIELQRRFYEKINWRMEPISMYKEIRNTRFMGLALIITASLTLIYVLFSIFKPTFHI